MKGKVEVKAAINALARFVGRNRLRTLHVSLGGEEGQFFVDKICELRELIASMPEDL